MSKKSDLQNERVKKATERKRKKIIIVSSIGIVIIATIVTLIAATLPESGNNIKVTLGPNEDLRIPVANIKNGLNYYDYGGTEEIILWRDSEGIIKTAFDTCEDCYTNGNVKYSLNSDTLTCSFCGSPISVSVLGTSEWGGCKPVSIPVDFRNDTDTDVIIPYDVIAYAEDMFFHWDSLDFSISLSDYMLGQAHTH